MGVKIYSRYNRPLVSGLTCLKPSMTSQEFKEECNINVLLKKYAVQAKLLGLPLSEVIPQPTSDNFGDFTDVDDFQTAMNRVAEVNNMFSNLPADIRDQCNNKPENFLRMLHDDKRYKEFVDRGILDREQVQQYFSLKDAQSSNNGSKTHSVGSESNSDTKSEVIQDVQSSVKEAN